MTNSLHTVTDSHYQFVLVTRDGTGTITDLTYFRRGDLIQKRLGIKTSQLRDLTHFNPREH